MPYNLIYNDVHSTIYNKLSHKVLKLYNVPVTMLVFGYISRDRGYKLKGIGQVKDPPFLMLWYKRVPMCKGRAHLAPKTPL